MDGVPNVEGLDPRAEPVRTAEWLAGLLGDEFRSAALHVRFSSSTCVGLGTAEAPTTLSAHIYAWLDEPLGHVELKAIILALNARAVGNLPLSARQGSTRRLVDWKVTEPQQPCYVAPPEFRDGLTDPFAGGSRAVTLSQGRAPTLAVASLREALGTRIAEPPLTKGGKGENRRKKSKRNMADAVAPRHCLPLSLVEDAEPDWPNDLAAILAGAEAPRTLTLHRRTKAAAVRADRRRGAARAVRELVRVVRARSGPWGRAHPEFGDWARAGRVPEGERDLWAHAGAALLAEAASSAHAEDGTLARAVDQLAVMLCGEDWTHGNGGAASSLAARFGALPVRQRVKRSSVRQDAGWTPAMATG